MDINNINLRKCKIEELSSDVKAFKAKDLYDDTIKTIILTGKQRMFYTDYQKGSIIYTAKTSNNEWRLVTGTNFKTNNSLFEQKEILDRYFDKSKK